MPTLEWIGKNKVINHDKDVPFKLLDAKYSFDENGQHEANEEDGNMIIHGDNLAVLKSLLPKYGGRVDCIYIDPPYNTGNEKWKYNDNVNDPQIKEWLDKVVGGEGEDLSRHDKWLCMMYPRLKLLHILLRDEGIIFISINDNELADLLLLCNEIFGTSNLVTSIPRKGTGGRQDSKHYAIIHEYVVCYAKDKKKFVSGKKVKDLGDYKYVDRETGKSYKTQLLRKWGDNSRKEDRPNLFYPIYYNEITHTLDVERQNESDIEIFPMLDAQNEGRWRWGNDTMRDNMEAGFVEVRKTDDGTYIPYEKIFMPEDEQFGLYNTWLENINNATGKTLVKNLIGESVIEYPKPVDLIEKLICMATGKENALILDSFAGSGTTAHAILHLNKNDGQNRKFILVEMSDYAETTTAERVRRVISGYTTDKEDLLFNVEITANILNDGKDILKEAKECRKNARTQYDKISMPKMIDNHLQIIGTKYAANQEAGTGGSFTFYELGLPLFDEDGNLNGEIATEKIREYIWYTETQTVIENRQHNDNKAFLGVYRGTAYYFHYCKNKITTLNTSFLRTIKTKADGYLIYADKCNISSKELKAKNIVFKKIPRDITKL